VAERASARGCARTARSAKKEDLRSSRSWFGRVLRDAAPKGAQAMSDAAVKDRSVLEGVGREGAVQMMKKLAGTMPRLLARRL